MVLKEPVGHLASVWTQETDMGSRKCPYVIQGPPGTVIKFTLFDFARNEVSIIFIRYCFIDLYSSRLIFKSCYNLIMSTKGESIINKKDRSKNSFTSNRGCYGCKKASLKTYVCGLYLKEVTVDCRWQLFLKEATVDYYLTEGCNKFKLQRSHC